MARNCEKHFVGLNRVHLEKQWKRDEELKRPPLHTLTTASEVRKWIPSIKKDIDYCLRQLGGARKHDYQETKMQEFEERVEQLQREHKRFVAKVFELDPTQQGIPWEAKSYVRKRKVNETNSPSDTTSSSSNSRADDGNHSSRCSSGAKKKRKPIVLNILKQEQEEKEEESKDE